MAATKIKEKEVLIQQEDALSDFFYSLLSNGKQDEAPDWATEEIRFLPVKVSGTKVFIPADLIFTIKNVSNCLTPSTHMPSWVYQLNDDEDENIEIINTKKLIFDDSKSKKINLDSQVIAVLIDDGAWGLACDSISKIMYVKKQNIKWRKKDSKRRWSAGTCAEYRALIFDVRHIEKILISAF